MISAQVGRDREEVVLGITFWKPAWSIAVDDRFRALHENAATWQTAGADGALVLTDRRTAERTEGGWVQ